MRKLGVLFLPLAPALFAAYTYYYSDPLTSVNTANWTQNGSVTATTSGLTATSANGGSLISKIAVPDGSSQYEVRTVLNLTASGGTYVHYLHASTDAMTGSAATGTYYSVEVQNPVMSGGVGTAQLVINKRVGGVITQMYSTGVLVKNGSIFRSVIGIAFAVRIDDVQHDLLLDTSIPSGKPGVGAYGTPAGNSITSLNLGPLDRVAPPTVNPQTVGSSLFPNRVDLQWQGVGDDVNGVGLWRYIISRNDGYAAVSYQPEWSDETVTAGTSYTYTIVSQDIHENYVAGVAFPVVTPPASAIDPRRVGVRPTGSYWGTAGEQIDTLSGNLNFTMPLFKALGRGGSGVGFALSYNAQNWRKDAGGTWNLGRDVGYGYGWKLLAGSLTPYYSNYLTIDHYLFIDSTGAEYRLDVPNGGVWTSSQSIYVSYDSNANKLYFPDGSFWLMGATSAGTEQDAGTQYPTLIQDTNGNQIVLAYNAGLGVSWTNSSARIGSIEDTRGVAAQGYKTFAFTYSADPIPHLTTFTSYITGVGNRTLSYSLNQPLNSPFSPSVSFGTTTTLASVSLSSDGLPDASFQYDVSGSGELTKATTPRGAVLQWAYRGFTYTGARTLREVQNRYLTMLTGGTQYTYPFTHNDAVDAGLSMHSKTTLDDPSGIGEKTWNFATSGSSWQLGLLSSLNESPSTAQASTPLRTRQYTWVQDSALNPYLGTVLTTLDPTGANAQTKTTQTIDAHGNLLQTNIYDFGNLTTAARTYNYTYNYSFSVGGFTTTRLTSANVTNGTQTFTTVTNSYDSTALTNVTGIREHDAAYTTALTARGNVSLTTPLGGPTQTITRDIAGNVISVNDGLSHTVSSTINSSTNFVAPSVITTNSDANSNQTLGYTASLTPNSYLGPNTSTASAGYDTLNRPTSTTSVHGVVTTYSYSNGSAIPSWIQATTNGHWVKTTLDGFERPIKVEKGFSTTTVSVQDTVYGPCACSPNGKVKQVSQPYAPGAGTIYQTVYNYDGLGRPSTTVSPDGASTTTYAYAGNASTVTDPAGKWKQSVMDVFGNIKTLNEPNPAGGANLATNYTYDPLNHLTQVSMPRGSTTQVRTFVFSPTTGRLQSETHPESGTKSYTYNPDGTLLTVIDAKNQMVKYIYDTYKRTTQIQVYPSSTGPESTCQRVTFTYGTTVDTNYTWGRPTNISWGPAINCSAGQFSYAFSKYTQGGLAMSKNVNSYIVTYTYTQDRVLNLTYPAIKNASGNPANRTYTYTYDAMDRPATMVDSQGLTWVQSTTYGPAEQLTQLVQAGAVTSTDANGNVTGVNYATHTYQYNSLLQMTGDGVNAYFYSATQNNGRSTKRNNTTFTYDALNRLSTGTDTGWGDTYTYDGFGNLTDKTVTAGSAPSLHVFVDPANNRVTGSGYTYDANGNVTAIPGVGTFTYDYANRLSSSTSGSVTTYYAYGPDNRRVWTQTGTSQISLLYGVNGELLGKYNNTGSTNHFSFARIYFGGRWFWTNVPGASANVQPDRIGSVGNYYPYGELLNGISTTFATYEANEPISGVYYAQNRYYNSTLARFMSPDPYSNSGGPEDPGSWNRYVYTKGDPINRNDPTGLFDCAPWEGFGCDEGSMDGGGGGGDPFGGRGGSWAGGIGDPSVGPGGGDPFNGWPGPVIPGTGFLPGPGGAVAAEGAIAICIATGACEVGAVLVAGGVAIYGAWELGQWLGGAIFKGQPKILKPKNGVPTGTKDIDEAGLSRDQIHDVKKGVGAGAQDWVGIAPNGDVIIGDTEGNAHNEGSWRTYTHH